MDLERIFPAWWVRNMERRGVGSTTDFVMLVDALFDSRSAIARNFRSTDVVALKMRCGSQPFNRVHTYKEIGCYLRITPTGARSRMWRICHDITFSSANMNMVYARHVLQIIEGGFVGETGHNIQEVWL